ncbi:MAG TPA: hypothetical protein PLD23_00080 [Armatimonadota bacterium]|nr:hypothetical protein [Armatimonadota bacterium]
MTRRGDEHLLNTSVCRDGKGFLMAYESSRPAQWSFRFVRSSDLSKREPVEGIEFGDLAEQTACANPTIRVAMCDGSLEAMLRSHSPEGAPMVRFDATKGGYIYP